MELSKKQKNSIEEIAQKYGLRLVLLFGSQASGKAHPESDFDIAYISARKLNFEEEYHLNFEFTNIFHMDRIDTVDIKKASPLMMYSIFDNPQILYQEDDLIFPRYQTYAFKLYVEAKPLYELKHEYLKKTLDNS